MTEAPARIYAITARKSRNAVVFRRGPSPQLEDHFHHTVSGKFQELDELPDLHLREKTIDAMRFERDGWTRRDKTSFVKDLTRGLTLVKHFPSVRAGLDNNSIALEDHALYRGGEMLMDGASWQWADYDAVRRRIVFAENGAMYAISAEDPQTPPVLLYDLNCLKYDPRPAPY